MSTHPGVQGARRATDLGGYGFNGSPLRGVAGATFANQAHSALADFGGILYGFLYGSIFSRVELPQNPGRFIREMGSTSKPLGFAVLLGHISFLSRTD